MWQPFSFLEAIQLKDCPITFSGTTIKVGDFIEFTQCNHGFPEYGRIQSIDLVSDYPLRIEWYTWHDVKRISRFKPEWIESIKVKESLDEARASATAARRTYAEQTPRGESSAE